jgi:hypothetical protein
MGHGTENRVVFETEEIGCAGEAENQLAEIYKIIW